MGRWRFARCFKAGFHPAATISIAGETHFPVARTRSASWSKAYLLEEPVRATLSRARTHCSDGLHRQWRRPSPVTVASPSEQQRWEDALMTPPFLDSLPNSPHFSTSGRDRPGGAPRRGLRVAGRRFHEGIFFDPAPKHTAAIHKSGGGTGFSCSRCVPRTTASRVRTRRLECTGAVDDGGAVRRRHRNRPPGRGAARRQMANWRVDHPDILELIDGRPSRNSTNNFNLSVAPTDSSHGGTRQRRAQTTSSLNGEPTATLKVTDGLSD